MTGYVIKRSGPGLWTVGHYDGLYGKWVPESDHGSATAAAARVWYLNGGKPPVLSGEVQNVSTELQYEPSGDITADKAAEWMTGVLGELQEMPDHAKTAALNVVLEFVITILRK